MSDERYPFERTECSCRLCAISCEHLPGALAPSDLPIIATHLGYADVRGFAHECLHASEGATIRLREGRVMSLPTLVPRTREDGACRFLSDEGRCTIHAVAPFGCAQIDAHMAEAEYRRRADTLLGEQLDDFEAHGPYRRLNEELHTEGLVAPPLAERRARLADAMRREGLG